MSVDEQRIKWKETKKRDPHPYSKGVPLKDKYLFRQSNDACNISVDHRILYCFTMQHSSYLGNKTEKEKSL